MRIASVAFCGEARPSVVAAEKKLLIFSVFFFVSRERKTKLVEIRL